MSVPIPDIKFYLNINGKRHMGRLPVYKERDII